jgi:hypothetical protein
MSFPANSCHFRPTDDPCFPGWTRVTYRMSSPAIGSHGLVGWFVPFSFFATYIMLWVAVVFEGLLILSLLQKLSVLRRLAEQGEFSGGSRLALGSRAPEFSGIDLRSGERISIDQLEDRGGVIVFLSPHCSGCKTLVGSMVLANDLPTTVAFCVGDESACRGLLTGLAEEIHLSLTGAAEVAANYHVSGFPTAVVVDRERRIRKYGLPKDVEDLKALFARGLSERVGDLAPEEERTTALEVS